MSLKLEATIPVELNPSPVNCITALLIYNTSWFMFGTAERSLFGLMGLVNNSLSIEELDMWKVLLVEIT